MACRKGIVQDLRYCQPWGPVLAGVEGVDFHPDVCLPSGVWRVGLRGWGLMLGLECRFGIPTGFSGNMPRFPGERTVVAAQWAQGWGALRLSSQATLLASTKRKSPLESDYEPDNRARAQEREREKYVYIYIFIYTHIFIYIYTYIYIYIYIYIYMYKQHIFVCI